MAERTTYVNARNALNALFALGAVPIVNENDATATDEITLRRQRRARGAGRRARAGPAARPPDGGRRRALAGARDTGGPPDRRRLDRAKSAVLGGASPLGKGGMRSKVLAAEVAAAAGIPTVIAAGAGKDVLAPDPRRRAARDALRARRASAVRVQALAPLRQAGAGPAPRRRGRDAGRSQSDGASLLAVGVARCEGRFARRRRRRDRRARRRAFREGDRERQLGRAPSAPARPRGRSPRPPGAVLGRIVAPRCPESSEARYRDSCRMPAEPVSTRSGADIGRKGRRSRPVTRPNRCAAMSRIERSRFRTAAAQALDHHPGAPAPRITSSSGGLVIAPSEADETRDAYFASTPLA